MGKELKDAKIPQITGLNVIGIEKKENANESFIKYNNRSKF